jgi:hypothetical protein
VSSIILEGYGNKNLIATQGYVGNNAAPPDPPPEPDPSYWSIALTATTGGTVNPAAGNYQVLTTGSFQAAATAASGYSFLYWMLDAATTTDNPVTVTGTEGQQRTLQAVFVSIPEPPTPTPTVYTLTIPEVEGGETSLSTGEHVYNENTEITITATPAFGYRFHSWQKDGSTVDDAYSTYTFTITADTLLTPVFTLLPVQGDTALTLANLWTNLLAKMQLQGVNTAVTFHTLELGADDGVTGQPSQYWNDVSGDMIITPDGVELQHYSTGLYGKLTAKGFTDGNITDGDEVTDSYGNTWAVVSVTPYKIGGYNQCTLNLKLESNFAHPPNPSEITKTLEVAVVDIRNVYSLVNVEFTVVTLYPANTFFPYTFPFTLA